MSEDVKKSADKTADQMGWAENEKIDHTDDEGVSVDESNTNNRDDDSTRAAEDTVKSTHKKHDDGDTPEDDTDDSPEEANSDDSAGTENEDNETEDTDKSKIEIEIELPEESVAQEASGSAGDFQAAVREQIENCKFEIIAELQESVHHELADVMRKELRKVERRRRAGAWIRDAIILLLAAIVGYFGYCLYDARYFDFMKQDCAITNTCGGVANGEEVPQTTEEAVKDTAWYRRNYGYLIDSLRTNLNADRIDAYYLYSDDHKIGEIPTSYLLAMAYNRLTSNVTYDSEKGIMIPAEDLQKAFARLFGDTNKFAKQDFVYDCAEFKYDEASDSFTTPSVQCNSSSNRVIVEDIDEIYEEGNAMYFLTTAAVYDRAELAFYGFDNLFTPSIKRAAKDDFGKHKNLFNQYQYQFKKVGEEYFFSSIVKLK